MFFKQVKQTLKLGGFLGYSANGSPAHRPPLFPSASSAIRWQIWTALLVYVLPFGRLRALSLSKRLRFAAHLSLWSHSFTRLFAVVRAAMWERLDLLGLLRSYGTAGGSFTLLGAPHAAWLPGLEPAHTGSSWDSSALVWTAAHRNTSTRPRRLTARKP